MDGCPYEGLSPAAKSLADVLWSTWGADRQTTDWPSEEELEQAALACATTVISTLMLLAEERLEDARSRG